MNNEKKSLIFFGSGPVAKESLRLLANTFSIEAVITKPSTVKEMSAVAPNLCIYSVNNKSELDSLISSQPFQSKVGILIDFGIIVSQKVIDYFEFGIINSHFSLLPELRGADPISFAILEGRDKTGVSLMLLVEAMDEGPILSIGEQIVDNDDTTPSLTEKLIKLSYSLLEHTIPTYLAGEIVARDQSYISEQFSRKVSYTRKLTKSDGIIDWNKPAVQIEREIRAFSGWPKSRTTLGSVDVVITKAYTTPVNYPSCKPGDIELINDVNMLRVECGDGSLWIERLKPAGKNEMDSSSFINGYKNKLKI